MSKKKYILIVVIVVLLGGGYYWYTKSKSSTAEVQHKTVIAEKGNLSTTISGSGNVIVDQLATVDPTITGTVSGLSVKVGDSVKKGQLLFVIINDKLSVSVSKAGVSYAQAKKNVDDAKYNKKQAQTAYNKNKSKALKDKLALVEKEVELAEQSLMASFADYQSQVLDASERRVLAPIDGTVNEINIKNGDDLSKVSSGSTKQSPIIIGDLGTLKASVAVNEVDISNVVVGQKVDLKLSAIEDLVFSGKVEKIDSLGTISQGVVTYNVTIIFDEIDERIKPQMSISASIITDIKENVITVPNSAVKTEGNKTFVEILDSDKVAQKKSVEIGVANNTKTEIVKGISVGDKVITQTIDPTATKKATSTNSNVRIPGMGGMR